MKHVNFITPWKPFKDFCEFYKNMGSDYKEIVNSSDIDVKSDGVYNKFYTSGGYGYEPVSSRNWLIKNTSIGEGVGHGGTCLDVGSGDGFWTWILSEFYNTTGIEPCAEGVQFSNAIRKRLDPKIRNRTRFIIGDALGVRDGYDFIFCRAPCFLNYPINKPFSKDLLDLDRKKLFGLWRRTYSKEKAQKLIGGYQKKSRVLNFLEYADKANEYFEKMVSIADKYFLFILSTKKAFYGEYLGDTYNHDPQDVYDALKAHGDARVKVVDGYIVAELMKWTTQQSDCALGNVLFSINKQKTNHDYNFCFLDKKNVVYERRPTEGFHAHS